MLFVTIFVSFALWKHVEGSIESIPMKVINHAGAPIELFWVDTFSHTNSGKPRVVKQTDKPVRNNSETNILSYPSHQFTVKYYKPSAPLTTLEVNFTKGPREENIIITYNPLLGVMQAKSTTDYDEIKQKILNATQYCSKTVPECELSSCIAEAIEEDITRITDSRAQLEKSRDIMATRLRNYTCADPSLKTTTPLDSHKVVIDGAPFQVNTYLNMSHAKIWSADKFLSSEECNILMNHGKPLLKRATVAAVDGSSVVSASRKAQQAGYPIHDRRENDPLWSLYIRAMKMINQHTDYDLSPDGQEDFTTIQYNPSDEYVNHCDGQCDGKMHTQYGRIGTAVLYCKAAKRGGATSFTKADVFVNGKPGSASFFTYRGPDGLMDDGYTEHSGCPVFDGEKWISVIWFRGGVDATHPWTLYDPKGLEIMNKN
eukprot:gene10977-14745_t